MERRLKTTLPGGRFLEVEPIDSKRMSSIRGRSNKTTEKRFRGALMQSGVRGWQVQPGVPGRPDFFFPAEFIAIFVDGCFWHGCPMCGHIPNKNRPYWQAKIDGNRERDNRVTSQLESDGICVVRFWEHELKLDLSSCVQTVQDLL